MDNDKEAHELAEVTLELPVLLRALVMGFEAFRRLVLVKELCEYEAARHNEKALSAFLSNFRHQ